MSTPNEPIQPRSLAVLPLPNGTIPVWSATSLYVPQQLVCLESTVVTGAFFNFRCLLPVAAGGAPPATFNPFVVDSNWTLMSDGEPYWQAALPYLPGDVVTFSPNGSSATPDTYMAMRPALSPAQPPATFPETWRKLSGSGSTPVTVSSVNGSGITVSGTSAYAVSTNLTTGYGVSSTPSVSTTGITLESALSGSNNPASALAVAGNVGGGRVNIPKQGQTITIDSVYSITPLTTLVSSSGGGVAVTAGWHLEFDTGTSFWQIVLDLPTGANNTTSFLFGYILLKV